MLNLRKASDVHAECAAKGQRFVQVITAGVGHNESAGDDGAYDLLDVKGEPAEIGLAIAESLEQCDLWQGRAGSYIERGQPVYITVTLRIVDPKFGGLPEETDEDDE
jgi:hypothetical protein